MRPEPTSADRVLFAPQLFLPAVLLALIALLVAAPVGEAKQSDGGEDTTEGTCHMTGEIRFKDKVGLEPAQTSFTGYAEGTCTGTVNGVFMENERVYRKGAGEGLFSCSANRVTETGTMYFTRNTATRSDDVEVDFIAESQGVFGEVVTRMRGRVSGEAVGITRFRGDEQTLRECEAGTFRGGTYDADGRSITPLVG